MWLHAICVDGSAKSSLAGWLSWQLEMPAIARISVEENACDECRYEGPADCDVGAESAGAGVLGEAVPSTSSMKSRCRVSRPQLGRKDARYCPTEATKTDHEHQEKLPVSVEKLMPKLMAFDQDMEITVKLHRKPVPAS